MMAGISTPRRVLFGLAFAGLMPAAELHPESVRLWEQYTSTARAEAQERVRVRPAFLWLRPSDHDLSTLWAGKILTKPMADSGRVPASGGLIHDWAGAVLVHGHSAEQVLTLLDQYDRYRDFYRPTVVRSKLLASNGTKRSFMMRWARKTALASNIIDADYESEYEQLSPDQWWSVSHSTRVQEVETSRSGERLRPIGTGLGFLWRVYSMTYVTTVEQGAVIELRALVLSRDVPVALAWLVNPFISRLSRSALTVTLQQTRDAVLRE